MYHASGVTQAQRFLTCEKAWIEVRPVNRRGVTLGWRFTVGLTIKRQAGVRSIRTRCQMYFRFRRRAFLHANVSVRLKNLSSNHFQGDRNAVMRNSAAAASWAGVIDEKSGEATRPCENSD
jgi:hypothetical protein